jgi:hypothetical protein
VKLLGWVLLNILLVLLPVHVASGTTRSSSTPGRYDLSEISENRIPLVDFLDDAVRYAGIFLNGALTAWRDPNTDPTEAAEWLRVLTPVYDKFQNGDYIVRISRLELCSIPKKNNAFTYDSPGHKNYDGRTVYICKWTINGGLHHPSVIGQHIIHELIHLSLGEFQSLKKPHAECLTTRLEHAIVQVAGFEPFHNGSVTKCHLKEFDVKKFRKIHVITPLAH